MSGIKIGNRVYYKDNGPTDTGTIIDILLDDAPFVVKWDLQHPSVFEERELTVISQAFNLPPTKIIINKADENIDQFTGGQLVLID